MNAADFRAQMALLPEPPDTHAPPHWQHWRRRLWQLAQLEDVSNFWNWPPIYHTMLVNHFPIGEQLAYLQQDWGRWESVISDSTNEANQRNLINQCAHIRLFEQATGNDIRELGMIAEFGGGYGAMAQACYGAGFRGAYVIHDLPEFRLLQQWYLSQQVYDDLTLVWSSLPHRADLFIGIYSISEIPPSERNQWLVSDRYLLLCSSQFDKWDNIQFMRKVIESRPNMNWHEQQKESRPDHYLIGWPK